MTDAYSLLKEDNDYLLQENNGKLIIEPTTFLEVVQGILSFIGTLATLKVTQLLIEGILSFSGSISKSIKKIIVGSLTFSGLLTSWLRSGFELVIGAGAKFASIFVIERPIQTWERLVVIDSDMTVGSLTFSGAVKKKIKKIITGILTSSGIVKKKISITITGILSFGAVIGKLIKITLVGSLTFAGAVATFLVRLFPRNLRRIILLIRDKK